MHSNVLSSGHGSVLTWVQPPANGLAAGGGGGGGAADGAGGGEGEGPADGTGLAVESGSGVQTGDVETQPARTRANAMTVATHRRGRIGRFLSVSGPFARPCPRSRSR